MFQEKNINKKIKGLSLKTITISLIAVLLALCSIFIVSILHIRNGYETLKLAYEDCVKYRQDAQMLREGSYYLTEEVHLFVATGDKKYADRYFKEANVTKRRHYAIEDLRYNMIMSSAQEALLEAMNASQELEKREVYAICLVACAIAEENGYNLDTYLSTYDEAVVNSLLLTDEDKKLSAQEKRRLANELVFDDEYLDARNCIDSNIQSFLDSTYQLTEDTKNAAIQNVKNNLMQQCVFIVLVLFLTVVYSVCISRLVLKPLKIYMKCVREGRAFELLGAYEFKHLALTYNNIFEVQHENEKMLRQKAEHDSLTGLLNRGAYTRISAQYTEREMNLAALIIDIDNFKSINDVYGHAIGDDVIRSIGELLLNSFRPSDIIARIGGDEFIVIMLDVTIESAENIGLKIRNLNDALQKPTSDLPKTSLSVGAAFSEFGYSDELFKRADVALYQTKQNGKCGFSYNKETVLKPDGLPVSPRSKKTRK